MRVKYFPMVRVILCITFTASFGRRVSFCDFLHLLQFIFNFAASELQLSDAADMQFTVVN